MTESTRALVAEDLKYLKAALHDARRNAWNIVSRGAAEECDERNKRILAALQPHPDVSELAEALKRIAGAKTQPHHHEGLGGLDPLVSRASDTVDVAKAALTSFQSRQGGK